jgi:hypothetical protein
VNVAIDQQPGREGFRDELNFAEFPLASLSTSLPKNQKTLEFTDEIFDRSRNERVTRKLTITASDKYGLPTAMDDEVILGLIQLTAKSDFTNRRVLFTRYQLLKILDWTDDTRNYDRLEQSLNRWLGVTLYYDKSWWSKEEQCWVNEGFHILDHVTILDKERQRRKAKQSEADAGKSSFVWNEVVFNSFKAGYLKHIDYDFYKALESAVSKRMYRFLDKRFYHRETLEFDLRAFACEHIGLSKNYHTGELKRVLTPAIAELEAQHFLKPLAPEERFSRKARGSWSVVFVRQSPSAKKETPELPELVVALRDRGLSLHSARRLVAREPEAKIREKLALFDWLQARKDERISKNPAGFLYRAITDDFSLPPDFVSATTPKAKPIRNVVAIAKEPTPAAEAPKDRSAIDAFWNSIPVAEQERLEEELVAKAPRFLREHYMEGRQERGLLFQTVRQAIIDGYVRTAMIQQKAS